MSKLKVLCLHGVTWNAELMQAWHGMRDIEKRCSSVAEFHYVSSPHAMSEEALSGMGIAADGS